MTLPRSDVGWNEDWNLYLYVFDKDLQKCIGVLKVVKGSPQLNSLRKTQLLSLRPRMMTIFGLYRKIIKRLDSLRWETCQIMESWIAISSENYLFVMVTWPGKVMCYKNVLEPL